MNEPADEVIDSRNLFFELFNAKNEQEIDKLLKKRQGINGTCNWKPLGNNASNYGVIENQQASPIAALIEKITNSIDAILMKKCHQMGIDPESMAAPKTMDEAITSFFPEKKNWDLTQFKKKQAEDIQIIADGYYNERSKNTSLLIYDNGEGQHPEDFEDSFLSLLKGNKNKIRFVQGKYNMGGSGAIVFCGKRSYQLIASRRFDESGDFGFTLVREHPLSDEELKTVKNTWYEYLKIDGQIPAFKVDTLDLGLSGRLFKTGSIIKLYSYNLPSGSRSVISRDLNQSINEYLFEPVLPVLTVDKKERYPDDRNLERDLFGLKRRLEQDKSKYVEDYFSEEFQDEVLGKSSKVKVTCYIFKGRIDEKNVKESRDTIRREFFKNNMSVLFSINGQVHGHFTSEFISRSLKLNLLKHHLIIHVDCTEIDYHFRKELFMASRDRLKNGEETSILRNYLAKKLGSKGSRLYEIDKHRKDSIAVDSSSAKDLLKSFTKNLPMNSDLMKLLNQTFKIEQKKEKPRTPNNKKSKKKDHQTEAFNPQRFPTKFKLKANNNGINEVAKIPLGGDKSIRFETDVENHYFDRVEEPGEMRIAILNFKRNDSNGGNTPGKIDQIEDVFNVNKSSPKDGAIKITLAPKTEVIVGDAVQIKVTLEAPGKDFDEIFWVKVTEKNQQNEKVNINKPDDSEDMGLPEFILVYKEKKENAVSWEELENTTIDMGYKTVMYPMVSGENLEKIYINMDSNVLKTFKSKYKNANSEQIEISNNKYISSVYFHTLFLYTITKKRKYLIKQEVDGNEDFVDIGTYLRDIFETFYSEFILNFGGAEELMQGVGD